MKKLITITIILGVCFSLKAQDYEWAKSMGGSLGDNGYFVTTDDFGNVYTTGLFQGTADFDPDLGSYTLTSAGVFDIFVSKLDINGNFVWAKRMGGSSWDRATSIQLDNTGNVYITGYFQGTVDFDPGSGIYDLTSGGSYDIFVCKLDGNGSFLWAKNIGGSLADVGYSLTIDNSGSVYTTGYFNGTVDFDPGSGIYNLTSLGSADVFVSKLDVNGNFVWAKQMGGTNYDVSYHITHDDLGNIYTSGRFIGTAYYGGDTIISSGGEDIFVCKLDSNGNFIWTKQMGGTGTDRGGQIALDNSGDLYLTGWFQSTADFDPGIGVYNLTSAGNADVFLSKLDTSGNFIWAKRIGGSGNDKGVYISVDTNGRIYTSGIFEGTVDFDPNASTYNLSSAGGTDISICKLDTTGNFLWAKQIGGIGNESGGAFVLDANGNIHITGNFESIVDFDPGTDTVNLTSAGNKDVFVSKWNPCFVNVTDTQTACDSYTWIDGNTYTTSNNTATHVLVNAEGCDSVVTLDLTINSVNTNTVVEGVTITTYPFGSSYQWLDCDNDFTPIPGATSYSFTPTANGNYAVQFIDNGCVDTSACVAITTVGIIENNFGHDFILYPNPTNGEITIELGETYGLITAKVSGIAGQTIQRKTYQNTNKLNFFIDAAPGIYFIELTQNNKKLRAKIIKN